MDDWNTSHRAPAPRTLAVLDVYSGIGGISFGIIQSGHDVWGVDSNPALEEDYMKTGAQGFICADALEVLEDRNFMSRFDAVAASPPCQNGSDMCNCRPGLADTYPQLIPPTRERLIKLGIPFTIENVSGSRGIMRDPVTLCMWGHFGRETYRHRLVEAGNGVTLTPPPAPPEGRTRLSPTSSIMNKRPDRPHWECGRPHPVAAARAGHWKPGMFVSVSGHERREPVRKVMEIPWARKREDVVEAVPPYVGYWLGQELARAA
jgi:DNA (cytosine-5)-methyltransferase 1